MAITGKPLGATATMWDTLGWGGETQALIYHPGSGEVIGVNGLGVAPTGAKAELFRERGEEYLPAWGPLAAVTPGTPGALMTMLADWGTLSLEEVLKPSIQMAEGYPMEAGTASRIEGSRNRIAGWPYSKQVFLPHLSGEGVGEAGGGAATADELSSDPNAAPETDGGRPRAAPYEGEIFRQPDLARTLRKLVEAQRGALAAGADREEAIYAAYDRFYRGDIAAEIVRSTWEKGA